MIVPTILGGRALKLLITGICGFVGSAIARHLSDNRADVSIHGIDNLARRGSEINRSDLSRRGIDVRHGDLRMASDLETLPAVDWVLDAAALPSVLAGVDGVSSSLQLVEHNLVGTLHLLEFCKRLQAGLILLSTSRVYSIAALTSLPLEDDGDSFVLVQDEALPSGVSSNGITESFSTAAPVSMYGASKIASETMALEYGLTYQFPVLINRCGVLAGAGQFGRADQGIFSYWIHSHRSRLPLRYLGFQGTGFQVRDCLNVRDLARLVAIQLKTPLAPSTQRTINVSGGRASAISLKQLTAWCDDRFGKHPIASSDEVRPFDLPWVVLDSERAARTWDWKPRISLEETLSEIADHAERNPGWLEMTR